MTFTIGLFEIGCLLCIPSIVMGAIFILFWFGHLLNQYFYEDTYYTLNIFVLSFILLVVGIMSLMIYRANTLEQEKEVIREQIRKNQ